MTVGHAGLAQEALDKSLEIREEAGLPFGTPLSAAGSETPRNRRGRGRRPPFAAAARRP
jgi:hypothetical protein